MVSGQNSKTPERKDEEYARGNYAPVVDYPPGLKHCPFISRGLIQLGLMVARLLAGASLMTAHHFFYAYLNEKSFDPAAGELSPVLRNQNNINFIGTTIAHGARIALSMAVGTSFAQLFWETLRSRSHTIRQIDALVNCGRSPFRPSMLRAAKTSVALISISLIASATALVVILTPGSLTVSSGFQRSKICTVPSVPQNVTKFDYYCERDLFLASEAQPVSDILSLNSYLSPFQANRTVTCGSDTPCSYNVTFVGPALDCVEVTNQTDFTTFLNPKDAPPEAPFLIWNGSFFIFTEQNILGITILSRDLLIGALQAISCTAYNATYVGGVSLEENSASVQIWDVKLDSVLMEGNTFISSYGELGVSLLAGSVSAGSDAYTTTLSGSVVQRSSFFATTSTGNHTFTDGISHFATSLIQNISISLLSGNINYGLSNDTATNLQYINSTCSSSLTVYIYNPARLLTTYGVALGVTLLVTSAVVAYGWWHNGADQKLVFSDVIRIGLNEEMFDISGNLEGRTWVYLKCTAGSSEKLIPSSPFDDSVGNPHTSTIEIKEHTALIPRLCKCLTAVHWRMSLLILATLCCMTANHTYYQYLNGKRPTSSPHFRDASDWILDQTIVSDVGIALAYVGQTFLAVAIATSCEQIFWRTIRSRGHAISHIDALMKVQVSPISSSFLCALRDPLGMAPALLALLAASMPLLSIFAPGSIKVSANYSQSEGCMVLAPRNLSAMVVETTLGDYAVPIGAVMSSGNYLPPVGGCGSDRSLDCSYELQFVGPGLDCDDVPAPNNLPEPAGTQDEYGILDPISLYEALFTQMDDLTMQLSVQTWDPQRSVYQAANCTGVLRSYSVSISHTTTSVIEDVTKSRTFSVVHANITQLSTFAEIYLYNIIYSLAVPYIFWAGTLGTQYVSAPNITLTSTLSEPVSITGGIGTILLDGNITWSANLSLTLEEFAQNATLSLLSGQIFALPVNPDEPDVLENITTTCTYTFTAYEYTPFRLFTTYGVAIVVTVLCAIWGSVAIRRNGVEESMDFSRILRAILNERMYYVRGALDKDTVIKADETAEGAIAPL